MPSLLASASERCAKWEERKLPGNNSFFLMCKQTATDLRRLCGGENSFLGQCIDTKAEYLKMYCSVFQGEIHFLFLDIHLLHGYG